MKFENQQYHNCEIKLDNGDKYRVGAHWLHNKNLDQWQGWLCDAGHKRIDIDQDFNVYSAQCKNEYLGNIFVEWETFSGPSICKQTRCTGCTDDLLQHKRKLNNEY